MDIIHGDSDGPGQRIHRNVAVRITSVLEGTPEGMSTMSGPVVLNQNHGTHWTLCSGVWYVIATTTTTARRTITINILTIYAVYLVLIKANSKLKGAHLRNISKLEGVRGGASRLSPKHARSNTLSYINHSHKQTQFDTVLLRSELHSAELSWISEISMTRNIHDSTLILVHHHSDPRLRTLRRCSFRMHTLLSPAYSIGARLRCIMNCHKKPMKIGVG